MNENTIKLLNELTDKLGVGAGELLNIYTWSYFLGSISYVILGIIIFMFSRKIDAANVFSGDDFLQPFGKAIKYGCMFVGLILIFANVQTIFYPEGAATQALILNLKP